MQNEGHLPRVPVKRHPWHPAFTELRCFAGACSADQPRLGGMRNGAHAWSCENKTGNFIPPTLGKHGEHPWQVDFPHRRPTCGPVGTQDGQSLYGSGPVSAVWTDGSTWRPRQL